MEGISKRETLIDQIFELFDSGEQAVVYLNENGLKGNAYLLEDLERLCTALADAIKQLSPGIRLQNKLEEIGKNAPSTVAWVRQTLDRGTVEEAEMRYGCSFVPLFLFWRRYAEVFLIVAADEESMRSWQQAEAEHLREVRLRPKEDTHPAARYDFSIVVLFYGNRGITQECLDAIHAHTIGRSYELITVDNGSDPETAAWCESLPHKKKIRYPYNMGSSAAGNLIFTMAPLYMEGKYLLYVSNDVVVTPGYAESLYQCLESDPRIAVAVPLCNSASNLQAIPVPYQKNDLSAMLDFAKGYNRCDPTKWEDRARLFSILAAYRPEALQQMYLAVDPLFCYDMFADDDHSCALRRMGWRQVLCRDVFVHHYGSATIGESQFAVMDLGREQFYSKHGVDAWNSLGTDLIQGIDGLSFSALESVRVLALNPLFGESALALCGRLKMCGCKRIIMDALTEDERYLPDMEALFGQAGLLCDEKQVLGKACYDIVVVASGLERCRDMRGVLRIAAARLKQGGLLITQHRNLFQMETLSAFLMGGEPVHDVFLHDPAESPTLQVVLDKPLVSFLQSQGLALHHELTIRNDGWRPAADRLAAALGRKADTVDTLVRSGKFSLWVKRPREK